MYARAGDDGGKSEGCADAPKYQTSKVNIIIRASCQPGTNNRLIIIKIIIIGIPLPLASPYLS